MTAVPAEPLDLEAVLERWPTVRQSLASAYDDCPLSAWLSMKYARGWSTTAQASGTLFHRAAAEILRTMMLQGSTTIPRREAIEILIEVCHQRDVPPEDIVRVPLRQMRDLRMAVDKFAKDNEFSIHRIVDIEKRLSAPLRYPHPSGSGWVERMLTGQLDVLIHDPAKEPKDGKPLGPGEDKDGAIVIDWKSGWGLPPSPRDTELRGFDDEELKALSFHGYFQQRWYGWLVMSNYPSVHRVTLREFYPRKTVVRKATLHRDQLPDVEEELGILVAAFDRALMQGEPRLTPDADGLVNIDELQFWKPSPGRHCGFCSRPTVCPIPEDVRVAAGGAVTSEQSAQVWAARFTQAERIRKAAIEGLKGWVETGGRPIPVKWSKGRQVIGWYQTKRGRRFGLYVPDESDRGGHVDAREQEARLRDAMRSSTRRAREERGVQPKRRRRSV